MIKEGISIDHFVPWSYVTHDLLWNLSPTTGAINSSKGNNLPSTSLYLDAFAKLQYEAFIKVYQCKQKGLLEDFSIAFQDDLDNIAQYETHLFESKIKAQLNPLIQIAENLGFQSNWAWEQ
jgi:CRISPR/Cas system Type II protein with McrA/HNH and RuvC-like nuclease domain